MVGDETFLGLTYKIYVFGLNYEKNMLKKKYRI